MLQVQDIGRARWVRDLPRLFWEDDGQDEHDAETVRGGPNRALSLRAAQANYSAIGAYDECAVGFVRPPANEEKLK